jgi:hypothetical protein
MDKRVWRRLAGAQRASGRAQRCSPTAVEEDEPDEVGPVGCSPEHERWLELGARAKKGAKELRRVGKKGW